MKSYLTFSKGQKIGVVTIAIIILIQIIVLNTENGVGMPDPFIVDNSDYLIEEENASAINGQSSYNKGNKQSYDYVLYDFNPNSILIEEWLGFGFSEKQAKTIISYKTKIGGFKKKEDLQKVYVISKNKYAELEPYIKIESKSYEAKTYNDNSEKIEVDLLVIELNSATHEELINIKGVGDYTAKGILKYKKILGGFHSVNQLKEVYGISDDNYEKIKPQIEIDISTIIRLNVNYLSVPELKKHPYITWEIANAIIDKRLIDKLTTVQFLVEDNYITQEELDRLLPYIKYV